MQQTHSYISPSSKVNCKIKKLSILYTWFYIMCATSLISISEAQQINMVQEIKKLDQSLKTDTEDVLVYVDIKETGFCNAVLISMGGVISTDSIVVSYCKKMKLESDAPFRTVEGTTAFIDDLQDERLNSFKVNYTPLSEIIKSFTHDFIETSSLGQEWNIAEIGYTTVNDGKNPWRWAVTFINKTNKKLEKKSFLFEKGKWILQKAPEIEYYFASYLTDFEK